MNIRKIRIFYQVALELNMTTVSRKLFITQPAISQCISEIERELKTKLFDRINNKLVLTNAGAVFLNYARQIITLFDEAQNIIQDMDHLDSGKLMIGASTTIGIYILPEIIEGFSRENSNIDISIQIENTENICKMILDNKIDFAFVEGFVHTDEIIVEPFWDDELLFILPAEYKNKKNLHREELLKNKIIIREKGSGTREVFEKALEKAEIDYKISLELGNTEAIKKAVEAGMGISCVSEKAIKNEIKNHKLKTARIENIPIKRKLNLVYHKDKFKSKLFNSFIDFSHNYNIH